MAAKVDVGGEREEGEIVENTEYEDISSDEEFSLRLRIEELEARNFELEQIANISGFATDPYDLNAGKGDHVGKENQQKHRSRNVQKTPRKSHRTISSLRPGTKRKRDKSLKLRKRKKRLPSSSSSDSANFLDRAELKVALNRAVDDDVIEIPVEIPVITIDDDENDEDEDVLKLRLEALQSKQEIKDVLPEVLHVQSEEPEEQELRLIALKSAVVNKHEARKRRRELECPYSPTDDLECVAATSPEEIKVDECSMDISPLESPAVENCIEIDMEISNDAVAQEAVTETPKSTVLHVGESDDEMTLRNHLLSELKKAPDDPESPVDVNLEEDCLRSLLLSSLKKPRTPPIILEQTQNSPEQSKTDEGDLLDGTVSLDQDSKVSSVEDSHEEVKTIEQVEVKTVQEVEVKIVQEVEVMTIQEVDVRQDETEVIPEADGSLEIVPLVEKMTKNVERSPLVTDLPVLKVTPLIIKLGESESETDDWAVTDTEAKDLDVDNKSPSSLVMDSPCDSPASPAVTPATQTSEAAGTVFQEKLDLFLKQARINVEKNSPPQKNKTPNLHKTPLALSHLPMSSQLEYRRLVARMNLLEKQKKRQLQQKQLPAPKKLCQGIDTDKTILKTSNSIKVVIQTDTEGVSANDTGGDITVVVRKDEPLRKKVLMKTATTAAVAKNGIKPIERPVKRKPPPPPKLTVSPQKVPKDEEIVEKFLKKVSKLSDEKKLKALDVYECQFAQTSSTFLTGLDDLLVMVKTIQNEKIEQYRLQDELMRLQKQTRAVEEMLAQKKGIVQKLTPKMTAQHKDILKHRNKCVTLNKMCLKLGQMVDGSDYRLPNSTKKKLMDKFKVLAVETKRLKEIQSNDGAKTTKEEPQNAKEDTKEKDGQETTSSGQGEPTHKTYKSPLDHMNTKQTANPDAVVCPYDLLGKCEDSECKYSHLNCGTAQASR